MGLTRSVSRFCFLLTIALYWSASTATPTLAAARIDPDCSEVCALDAQCDTSCVVYAGEIMIYTDCGAVTGDQCENTCDTICTPAESDETECTDMEGSPTTCGAYGVYLQCGDDFCVTGVETCSNCSADCLCPTAVTDYTLDPDDDESICDNKAAAGMSGIPCPTPVPSPEGLTCADKGGGLSSLNYKMELLAGYIHNDEVRRSQCGTDVFCQGHWDSIKAEDEAALTTASNNYFLLAGSHCYPGAAVPRTAGSDRAVLNHR